MEAEIVPACLPCAYHFIFENSRSVHSLKSPVCKHYSFLCLHHTVSCYNNCKLKSAIPKSAGIVSGH